MKDSNWSGFIQDARQDARGAALRNPRILPVAMAEGPNENLLVERLVSELRTNCFQVLDLRITAPTRAIETLRLPWPRIIGKWPPMGEYLRSIPIESSNLAIVGGARFDKAFWGYLCDESVLYDGAGLPPPKDPLCLVVPDSAVVVAAVAASSWANYHQRDYFGPVYRFSELSWFSQ